MNLDVTIQVSANMYVDDDRSHDLTPRRLAEARDCAVAAIRSTLQKCRTQGIESSFSGYMELTIEDVRLAYE